MNEQKETESLYLWTKTRFPDPVPITDEDWEQAVAPVMTEELRQQANDDYKQQKFIESGVGQRYLNKTLKDFICKTSEQKNNLEAVQSFIKQVENNKNKTLWLCGNAGTGKTFLASMIVRETVGKYSKSYEIQLDIEDSKSFKAVENKKQVLERYCKYPVLVIDEVGKFESKQEIEYLFIILNERYERKLSTVLVTNKNKNELVEYLGKPIYDRFTENCTSLEFNGESYRRNERE